MALMVKGIFPYDSTPSRSDARSGEGDKPLDPVEEFQVQDWIEDLEGKRQKAGAVAWLP
jgi:hypothetical protein